MAFDLWSGLALIASIIIVGVIMLLFIGQRQISQPLDRQWYQEQWRAIHEQVGDGAAGRQLAIINADKLLDHAMRDRNFKGDNMGQRLKNHPKAFSQLNDVWTAHKLRNRIAHENGVDVSESETKKALSGIERGLRDLGAL